MRRGALIILLLLVLVVGGGVAAFFALGDTSQIMGTVEPTPAPIPREPVVVARFAIPANTVITDTQLVEFEDLEITEITEDMVRNTADVINQLTVNPIPAGQIIRLSDLTEPGLSQRIPQAEPDDDARPKAYPVLVNSLTGVADQLRPGDTVDIVATLPVPVRVGTATDYDFENDLTRYAVNIEEGLATKTIVQRAQVLRILRPAAPPADGEDGEGPPPGEDLAAEGQPPPTDPETGQPIGTQDTEPGMAETLTGGSWVVVVAISDQEAELVEFAQATIQTNPSARITMVLRGFQDEQVEETVGASMDILVNQYGLPIPEPILPPVLINADTPLP